MAAAKPVLCMKCETITAGGKPCNCPPAPVAPDVEGLIRLLEDEAARFGTAASQPLDKKHTRTNRVKLNFLSCGLNEAVKIVRQWARP